MYEAPRYYVLSADRFDGTTALSETWAPDENQNTPRHVATQAVVGRISFADLARPGTSGCVVLVRRWSPADEADRVEVRSVSEAESPDEPPTKSLDTVLETTTLLSTWSKPLYLGPTDAVAIYHLPVGGGTVELLVGDEIGAILEAHLQAAEAEALAGPPVTPLGTQTLSAAGQVEPVNQRDLLVLLNFAADGDVTLPALADASVGVRITFLRISGAGIPTIVTDDANDKINGSATATYKPYPLRSLQDSVTYVRVPDGWVRGQGMPAGVLVNTTTTPIAAPSGVEGTQYIISRVAGAAVLDLPTVALCRVGYRVVVLNSGSSTLTVTPAGAERINRSPSDPFVMPSGSVAVFEVASLTSLGNEWIATQQNEDPLPIADAGAVVNVAAWRGFGRQIIQASNVAAQVNLPSLLTVALGASVLVENTGTGEVTITPNGDTINGQATRTVPRNRACLLVNAGTDWTAIDGASQPALVIESANIVVPAWIDSPAAYEANGAAGQTITLPAAADVAQGASIWIWNSTADAHSIAAAGSDLINGSATRALPANSIAFLQRVRADIWFAVVTAE